MESTNACQALASICGFHHHLRHRQGVLGCRIGPSHPNIGRKGRGSLGRRVHSPSPSARAAKIEGATSMISKAALCRLAIAAMLKAWWI